ncbi:hypothetical protein [Marinovum algicola]|uniref:hypothetical protein n=1 Tax=Marinovum algicola TaxID=42444 RepID=UPI0024BA6CB3|nr:hypothetical protein [Marinovum algicola]
MNWLLIANNLTSVAMVLSCWWLAHQYSRVKPPGRAIAAAFSLLGLSTLFTLLARNLGVPVEWPIVVSKAILAVGLGLIIVRRNRQGQR